MPIMFHVVYLIIVNGLITYNILVEEDERLEQKDFVWQWLSNF